MTKFPFVPFYQLIGLQKAKINLPQKSFMDFEDTSLMDMKQERGVLDLIKLDELTVNSILENLKERYDSNRYYVTYFLFVFVGLFG